MIIDGFVGEIWSVKKKKEMREFKNTKTTGGGRVDLWRSHVMYAYDFVKLFILEYRQVGNKSEPQFYDDVVYQHRSFRVSDVRCERYVIS